MTTHTKTLLCLLALFCGCQSAEEKELARKIAILDNPDFWVEVDKGQKKYDAERKIAVREEIPKLILDLKNGKDALERYAAIRGLLEFGCDAIGPLVVTLESEDPFVRGFSAFGIRKLAEDGFVDKAAISPLVKHLSDKSIFNFGGRKEGLTDEGPLYVAQVAASALAQYKDESITVHVKYALTEAKRQLAISAERHDEISSPEKYLANSRLVSGLEKALESGNK